MKRGRLRRIVTLLFFTPLPTPSRRGVRRPNNTLAHRRSAVLAAPERVARAIRPALRTALGAIRWFESLDIDDPDKKAAADYFVAEVAARPNPE